jgi:hypothetical protein
MRVAKSGPDTLLLATCMYLLAISVSSTSSTPSASFQIHSAGPFSWVVSWHCADQILEGPHQILLPRWEGRVKGLEVGDQGWTWDESLWQGVARVDRMVALK